MLATLNEDTARRVAEDVRDFGAGYIRIDHEGRASHVPSYLVVDPVPTREPVNQRMHE